MEGRAIIEKEVGTSESQKNNVDDLQNGMIIILKEILARWISEERESWILYS